MKFLDKKSRILRIAVMSVFLMIPFRVDAVISSWSVFNSFSLNGEALPVKCITQDGNGMMWIGTDIGLFSYDGYSSAQRFEYNDKHNTRINCEILYMGRYLILGTDNGLFCYDTYLHRYDDATPFEEEKVNALLVTEESKLWVGSESGLCVIDLATMARTDVDMTAEKSRGRGSVNSLTEYNGSIYIGSYWGLARYSPRNGSLTYLYTGVGSDSFACNVVMKDESSQCIWAGSKSTLVSYNEREGVKVYPDEYPSIKTMCIDRAGSLILGTESGIYIANSSSPVHLLHDSRVNKSLANNNIWTIYEDRDANVWIGNDFGISLNTYVWSPRVVSTHFMTGETGGNLVRKVVRDSRGRLWLGGSNGLIEVNRDLISENSSDRWYSTSSSSHKLSSNSIGTIFEDSTGNLWISTDTRLSRLDESTGRFVDYEIRDLQGIYSSEGTNEIFEDRAGNLWLATTNAGLMKVSLKKLLSMPSGGRLTADDCFEFRAGLKSNNVLSGVIDTRGKIWALLNNDGIERIDPVTGKIDAFQMEELGVNKPQLVGIGADGFIWVSYRGGLLRVNPETLEKKNIEIPRIQATPLSMAISGNEIWISTSEGLFVVDSDQMKVKNFIPIDRTCYDVYMDDERVLLGVNDGVMVITRGQNLLDRAEKETVGIVDIKINGKSWASAENIPVSDVEKIVLKYNENNVAVTVSDFEYSTMSQNLISWRISEKMGWIFLPPSENVIELKNIPSGKTRLEINRMSSTGDHSATSTMLTIVVRKPWWYSNLALLLYFLGLSALVLSSYRFKKLQDRMKEERIQMEKEQQQAALKMNFFTEVSHEFKTPLSLIMAPLSQMLLDMDQTDPMFKTLSLMNKNAIKLSTLIHQLITFYRDDTPELELVKSHVEVVGFAERIFTSHADSHKASGIEFNYKPAQKEIYACFDLVKTESVLNNLLSNAEKFTSSGGSISLSVEIEGDNVVLRVTDTGCGIPPEEQDLIFQRFYQASNSKSKGGTGIGLFMVQKYVELQGGSVSVESDGANGSTFVVSLPLGDAAAAVHEGMDTLPNNDRRPLILIVEDNVDLAEFIASVLSHDYRCVLEYNGKNGRDAAFKLHPDLIVTDLMMPVMSGFEMCRDIRSNPRTSNIPVIMLTAKDDKQSELESISLNVDSFIPKPFDVSILTSKVQQLVHSNKQSEKKVTIELVGNSSENSVESQLEKFLANVTAVIEKNISNPDFNVNALCEEVGFSQKYIYRKILKLTGMTTVEFIRVIRLKKAAMLLDDDKFSVSEVMYMVGFSNQSYFSKCFSQYFGMPPQQYRSREK